MSDFRSRSDRDNDSVARAPGVTDTDLRAVRDDLDTARRAIERADRWLAAVMKDADRVFKPHRMGRRTR
jgi:hypothetical protein